MAAAAAVHIPTAAEMQAIGKELADPTLNEIHIDGIVSPSNLVSL